MSRASTKRRIRKPVQAPEKTNMEDREGNARPTPQRIAQGRYRLVAVSGNASAAYAVDELCDVAAILHNDKHINAAQLEAARTFEQMAHDALGSPATRSCLDFSPVGHEPEELTAAQTAATRKRETDWAVVRHAVGPKCYSALTDALWSRSRVDLTLIQRGLHLLCLLWKIGLHQGE